MALLVAVAVAGCAGGDEDDDAAADTTASSSPEPSDTATEEPSMSRDDLVSPEPSTSKPPLASSTPRLTPTAPSTAAPIPSRVLDRVLAVAAQGSRTPADEIEVVRAAAVTFNDGSLGCPEPGRQYTQALVDGWWVVVEAGGEQLDYRMAVDGEPRLCEGGGTTPSPRRDT